MDNNDRRHGKHHHNYPVLQSMSDEAKDVVHDTEMKARIDGVSNVDVSQLVWNHTGRDNC